MVHADRGGTSRRMDDAADGDRRGAGPDRRAQARRRRPARHPRGRGALDVTHDMGEAAALEKDGVEAHLQELLGERPEWCGEGFRLVRREWPTDIGPVDLMCRDADDGWVAVEIKRVGTIDAVEQLKPLPRADPHRPVARGTAVECWRRSRNQAAGAGARGVARDRIASRWTWQCCAETASPRSRSSGHSLRRDPRGLERVAGDARRPALDVRSSPLRPVCSVTTRSGRRRAAASPCAPARPRAGSRNSPHCTSAARRAGRRRPGSPRRARPRARRAGSGPRGARPA